MFAQLKSYLFLILSHLLYNKYPRDSEIRQVHYRVVFIIQKNTLNCYGFVLKLITDLRNQLIYIKGDTFGKNNGGF